MAQIVDLIQLFWSNLQHGQLPELGVWNYVLLSLLIVLQGPISTLLGGAAASAGLLRPWLVFAAGVLGNLTADIVWFHVGRLGKGEWLVRCCSRLGLRQEHVDQLQRGMERHATKILLLAKLSAGFAVPALIAAGLTRLRWRRWFPIVFLGESLWTGMLVLVGYYATEAILQVEHTARMIALGSALAVLLVLLWLIPRWVRQNRAFLPPSQESHPAA